MGGREVGADGEPKAGSSIHLIGKAAIVCPLKCTNSHSSLVRPIRVIGSSLTSSVALLVHPRGTAHSIYSGLS